MLRFPEGLRRVARVVTTRVVKVFVALPVRRDGALVDRRGVAFEALHGRCGQRRRQPPEGGRGRLLVNQDTVADDVGGHRLITAVIAHIVASSRLVKASAMLRSPGCEPSVVPSSSWRTMRNWRSA